MTDSTQQRSNTPLYLLLGSFIIPAVLAYIYFFYGERPNISSNGELISPVVDIESFNMSDLQGQLQNREALTPRWRMYYFVDGHCDQDCQQMLYNMRQINKALGKNQDRVQHVVVHLSQPDADLSKLMTNEYPNAVQLSSSTSQMVMADQTIKLAEQNYIYLMDPLGNVMMRFSDQLNPKLILKDINKLLKISRIG